MEMVMADMGQSPEGGYSGMRLILLVFMYLGRREKVHWGSWLGCGGVCRI
jgi:hypothetical protein